MRRRGLSVLVALLLPCVETLAAQQPSNGTVPLATICLREATAGSATERTLLIVGELSSRASSTVLRPLGRVELDTLYDAVREQPGFQPARDCASPWSSIWARAWYNGNAAHTDRDGAVWQGRGVTFSVTGGVSARLGPLAVAAQPLATFSENREFTPQPLAQLGPGDFRHPVLGQNIDLPFRFGAEAYTAIDPGESYVRLQSRYADLGVTTQSQQWGPAYFYPLVLATEGAAFPRAFLESQRLPIWFGTLSFTWEVGLLEASPYSRLLPGERSRVSSALLASVSPRGLRWLELGGTRFFHVRRSPGALNWANATLPFSGILKNQSRDVEVGGFNQLGSVFFRVAPVGASLEAYGELYREDHNADIRDLILEPDHESAFTLGARRVWKRSGDIRAVTIEHANGRISHLSRVRGQSPIYEHTSIAEGHTFRGQPLGSSALLGGGGTVLAWSSIGQQRSRDVTLERRAALQDTEGGTWGRKLNGAYILRVGESRVLRDRTYGATVQLLLGYGGNNRSSMAIGFSRAN